MGRTLTWIFVLGVGYSAVIYVARRTHQPDDRIVAGTKIAPATDEEAVANYRLLYREWTEQGDLAGATVTRSDRETVRLRHYLAWVYAQASFSRLSLVEQTLEEKLPAFQQVPAASRWRLATLEKQYRESLQARGIKFYKD